jgi:hypothetical protein
MDPPLHYSERRAGGFGARFVVTVFTGTGVPLPKGFAHMLNHRSWIAGGFAALAVAGASPALAQSLPAVTIGGGLQSSYQYTDVDDADGTNEFLLNSARLYINGSAHKNIKFMFNTEYNGSTNAIGVLDAVAQISTSSKFNVWVGRFLPPSDRANLYGPYYSNHWGVYTDGIQDGYPFVATGRDNGVMYWGQFDRVKVSGGLFDGRSATGQDDVLFAGRVQVDLWDTEDGYYLNGTYYGAKDLLAIGGAVQAQDGDVAGNVDFLLEKKVGEGGAFSIESQYNVYDGLGGYDANYSKSSGAYILAAWLFPKWDDHPGQLQLLGKFAAATFEEGITEDYDQDTTEINVNYIIKEHNARVMFFFRNTTFSAVRPDSKAVGIGLQIQM